MKSIVIVAGGTGGHISPGVALAEVLTELKEKSDTKICIYILWFVIKIIQI